MNPEVIYQPSKWGEEFHALPHDEALGAGDLALDTEVPTPLGIRPLRNVRPGDAVFDETGKPCNVVSEQLLIGQQCYRVVFDDGTEVIAGKGHLWQTSDYLERKAMLRRDRKSDEMRASVRTMAEIAETLKYSGKTNHAVWNAQPLQMPEADLPVDPWLLGQWLANGRKDLHRGLEISSPWLEVEERVAAVATACGLTLRAKPGHGECKYLYVAGRRRHPNPLVVRLRELVGDDPFRIPEQYLLASERQRWELLRGLVDGDGHVNKRGAVELTFKQERLTQDAYRLACSLGFKCTIDTCTNRNPRTGEATSTQHRLHFSAVGKHVSNVAAKQCRVANGGIRTQRWRYIVSAERVDSVPTKCIQVDSPSRLFLVTRAHVPTHNSAGPGKSLVLLMEPLEQIQTEHKRCVNKNHPFHIPWGASTGWALHLRRTRPMLEHSLVRAKRMFPRIDPKVRYDADRYTFLFASGYRYQFGHCKDKDDWEQYLSAEFSIILYDELVQFLEEQYDQINTRLRSPDPVLSRMLKIRAMSNPLMTQGDDSSSFTIKNPFWVRDRFVKPARNGRVTFKRKLVDSATGEVLKWYKWIYLPATIDDNPDKAFVKQYKAQLLNAPRHIRQALLYGDWWLTVGAYFGEVWNESLNVCEPFSIPDDWPRFRSMDWGFKKPGCVHWWAMDDDENLFCEKEFTFKNQSDEVVAARIKEIEEDLGLWDKVAKRSRITGPADTQLWERRGTTGKTMAEVFAENGVSWVPALKQGKDHTGRGRGRAMNALRIYKRLGDHGRGTTTAGLVMFSTCSKLIETLPGVQQTPGDPDTPMDSKYDHWFDSACYACGYASRGRAGVGMPAREKNEWEEDDDDLRPRFAERGLSGYGM